MRGGTAAEARPRIRARGVSPCFFTAASRGEQHRGRAVIDAGSVAGGHRTGIAHDRLQLGQSLERGFGARMFVLVDRGRAGLAAGNRDRRDLLGKITGSDGLAGALLRADRERVLVRPRDLEFLGDVLAGLGHGVDAVLRLHQRVDEAPADGGVENIGGAGKCLRRLAHHERRPRHRFDAAGDCEIDLAGADRASGSPDCIEPRGAQAVQRLAGNRIRQARQQQRHPRHVAVVLAGLVGAAEINLVDRGPVEPGCRATSALIGAAARSSARTLASAPPKRPIGVLTASHTNTSRIESLPGCRSRTGPREWMASFRSAFAAGQLIATPAVALSCVVRYASRAGDIGTVTLRAWKTGIATANR